MNLQLQCQICVTLQRTAGYISSSASVHAIIEGEEKQMDIWIGTDIHFDCNLFHSCYLFFLPSATT